MRRIRQRFISNPNFNPKRVEKASSAAKGLCEWIIAMDEFEKQYKICKPKQEKYAEAKKEVDFHTANLKETRMKLSHLTQRLDVLQLEYQQQSDKLKILEDEIQDCENRLRRAKILIGGLWGEREKWESQATKFEEKSQRLDGDLVVCGAIITYGGALGQEERKSLFAEGITKLIELKMKCQEAEANRNLRCVLGSEMEISGWRMKGLGEDEYSIENGIILDQSLRYPFLIDPQRQGEKFIESLAPKYRHCRATDKDLQRCAETAIQFGEWLCVEMGEECQIPSAIENVAKKKHSKDQGMTVVKVGRETVVPISESFKLVLLTTAPKVVGFPAETCLAMNLIDFTITQQSLQDQLLSVCLLKEKPDLHEHAQSLIRQNHQHTLELTQIELKILSLLTPSILQDEQTIITLASASSKRNEIHDSQQVAQYTQSQIQAARQNLTPVAKQATLLFFTTQQLAPLSPVYRFSLTAFHSLYLESFERASKQGRLNALNQMQLQLVYTYISRALFPEHQLLFSFLIQLNLLGPEEEQRKSLLLKPLPLNEEQCPANVPANNWKSAIPEIRESLTNANWKEVFSSPDAHLLPFPEPFQQVDALQRLVILKVIYYYILQLFVIPTTSKVHQTRPPNKGSQAIPQGHTW